MPPKITRVKWSASNLPWGISFNEQTGTFSGTPEDAGEYVIPVTVETNYGKDTKDVLINSREKTDWVKALFRYSENNAADIRRDTRFRIASPYLDGGILAGFVSPSKEQYYYQFTHTLPNDDTNYTNMATASIIKINSKFYLSGGHIGTLFRPARITPPMCYVIDYCPSYQGRILRANGFGEENYKIFNNYTLPYAGEWYAACYNEHDEVVLFVSKNGITLQINNPWGSPHAKNTTGQIGHNINKKCAAWSSVALTYCVATTDGYICTSEDGMTWETHTAPDNFSYLEFILGLNKFLAYGTSTRFLWSSSNGVTWEHFSEYPIPLKTVNAIADGRTKGFCAVGEDDNGTGKYSYHLKADGTGEWQRKKICNEDITFINVIYSNDSIGGFIAESVSDDMNLYVLTDNEL